MQLSVYQIGCVFAVVVTSKTGHSPSEILSCLSFLADSGYQSGEGSYHDFFNPVLQLLEKRYKGAGFGCEVQVQWGLIVTSQSIDAPERIFALSIDRSGFGWCENSKNHNPDQRNFR